MRYRPKDAVPPVFRSGFFLFNGLNIVRLRSDRFSKIEQKSSQKGEILVDFFI